MTDLDLIRILERAVERTKAIAGPILEVDHPDAAIFRFRIACWEALVTGLRVGNVDEREFLEVLREQQLESASVSCFCTHCGNRLAADSVFCSGCGKRV